MDISEELQTDSDLNATSLYRFNKNMKPDARKSLQVSVLQEGLPKGDECTKQGYIPWDLGPREDSRHQCPRIHQQVKSIEGLNNMQATAPRRRSLGQCRTSNSFLKTSLATTSRQHHHQLHQEEIKNDVFGTRTRTRKDPEGKGRRRIRF